jgi:hypothetical protein
MTQKNNNMLSQKLENVYYLERGDSLFDTIKWKKQKLDVGDFLKALESCFLHHRFGVFEKLHRVENLVIFQRAKFKASDWNQVIQLCPLYKRKDLLMLLCNNLVSLDLDSSLLELLSRDDRETVEPLITRKRYDENNSDSPPTVPIHIQLCVVTGVCKMFILKVSPTLLVHHLKAEIERETKMSSVDQRLLFLGKDIQDDKELQFYGVSNHGTIQVFHNKNNNNSKK